MKRFRRWLIVCSCTFAAATCCVPRAQSQGASDFGESYLSPTETEVATSEIYRVATGPAEVVHVSQPPHGQPQCRCSRCVSRPQRLQFLPEGLLYESYLAGEKEPRLSGAMLYETDGTQYLDVALGGRVGLFRYGTVGPHCPQGFQMDFEGAAFPRLNVDENSDLDSADFRAGVPLTWRQGPLAVKFAYYHISSHVGDEFLARNPGFVRINYVRDSLVYGLIYDLNPDLKIYGEVGYAFYLSGGAEPWEFQFGTEYSPRFALSDYGAPFIAVNGHLREEVDFGGSVNAIAGWEWRSRESARQLRVGVQYFNGKSSQYAFFNQHEELLGFGIWFDY